MPKHTPTEQAKNRAKAKANASKGKKPKKGGK